MDDRTTRGHIGRPTLSTEQLNLTEFVRGWSTFAAECSERETAQIEAEYLRGYAQALKDVVALLTDSEALPSAIITAPVPVPTAEPSWA